MTIPLAVGLMVRNAFGVREHVFGQATQGVPGPVVDLHRGERGRIPLGAVRRERRQPGGVSAVSATLTRTCEFIDNRATPVAEECCGTSPTRSA